jgi:tetratricopeptide (TPR) repeat protein
MAREKLEEVFSKGRQIKNHHLVEPAIVLLQAYEKNKQYQSANELFKQYESILGESQVALTLAGSSCLNLNDSQQAENFLEGAIQKDSSYPDPYLLLGDLYAKSQPDKAVSYYSQYYDLRSSIMGARIFIKRVKSLLKTNSLSFKNLSIAFIGNFTIEPIKDFLEAECFKQSIQPKFYFGGYDQYIQESLFYFWIARLFLRSCLTNFLISCLKNVFTWQRTNLNTWKLCATNFSIFPSLTLLSATFYSRVIIIWVCTTLKWEVGKKRFWVK